MSSTAGSSTAAAPVVAVNPWASRLRGNLRLERLLDEIRRSVVARWGVAPDLVLADDPGAMLERVRTALDAGAPCVVVVGGDGTVRDVAAVMHGREVPMAIVPVGTANLFAAAIRVPLRLDRAVRAVAKARTRRVDLGRVRWGTADGGASEPRIFVVGAGIGFDARVMSRTSEDAKRRIGRYAYFLAAARELLDARASPTEVVADGERLDLLAAEVLVANCGELIPGVLRPALPISPADGRLDVFAVDGAGPMAAIRGGMEAILRHGRGRSGSGRSVRLRVSRIRVTGTGGEPVEVDGDVVGIGWLEAECLPGALRILVPPSARAKASSARRGTR